MRTYKDLQQNFETLIAELHNTYSFAVTKIVDARKALFLSSYNIKGFTKMKPCVSLNSKGNISIKKTFINSNFGGKQAELESAKKMSTPPPQIQQAEVCSRTIGNHGCGSKSLFAPVLSLTLPSPPESRRLHGNAGFPPPSPTSSQLRLLYIGQWMTGCWKISTLSLFPFPFQERKATPCFPRVTCFWLVLEKNKDYLR